MSRYSRYFQSDRSGGRNLSPFSLFCILSFLFFVPWDLFSLPLDWVHNCSSLLNKLFSLIQIPDLCLVMQTAKQATNLCQIVIMASSKVMWCYNYLSHAMNNIHLFYNFSVKQLFKLTWAKNKESYDDDSEISAIFTASLVS